MNEWIVVALVIFGVIVAGLFFWRSKSTQFKEPDEKMLNSSFDVARTKERQANDSRIKEIENEDRLRLLNDLNRR